MAIGPGARVGPYEIRSLLGAGGMGEVFLAHDARLGREVAIKILPPDVAGDPDRLRRFEVEARAASQLNHPNILTVYDVGSENGLPYVVTERLEGETLRERLSRGPLGEREALELARQIARGLAAAHGRGIVHRDLKPENLFLTRDGHAKILDFGLAKLSGDGGGSETRVETAYATEPGMIVGTVQYMAPEQVKGQRVDHRADLFAFGVVLYETVSGTGPFKRPSGAESMSAVLNDTPPPLDEVRAGLSPLLARVADHCLEKAPEQRFQSARDLLFALDSASSASTSGMRGQPAVPAASRPRSHVPIGVFAAAAAIAGLALGWWAGGSRGVGSEAPTFTRVTRVVATDAGEFSPVLSPDGKWLVYAADSGSRSDIFVKFLSGGEAVNLTAGLREFYVARRSDIGGIDISPDGTMITFGAGPQGGVLSQQSTYVMGAPLGGAPRKLIERSTGARWSPDGTKLVCVQPGGSAGDALKIVDANGGNPREILPVSGGVHAHWPSWSADGNYIYFNRSVASDNTEPTEIYRVPVAGGPAEPVVATSRRAVFPYATRDGRGLVYSSNPAGPELALWWKPVTGQPQRLTTGIGDYAEARLSADNKAMVATSYQNRRSLAAIPILQATSPQPTSLTEGASGDYDPAVSPRDDRLAFSSTRDGNRHIWTARLDGTDPRQVTSGLGIDERPAWSPDGSTIAFVSSRGGVRAIWLVGPDGGGLRKVAAATVIDTLAWSPDGAEILYAAPAGAAPSLFRLRIADGRVTRLETKGGATSPSWSPIRNLIAYVASTPSTSAGPSSASIAFMTPEGRPVPNPWPETPRLANGAVAWSPDGKWVVGLSDPGNIESIVWLFDVDGKRVPRKVSELGNRQRPRGAAWTPDNARVIIGVTERTSDIVLFDQGS
jgi:eukaryotic-like serine/threonine-protein kinase